MSIRAAYKNAFGRRGDHGRRDRTTGQPSARAGRPWTNGTFNLRQDNGFRVETDLSGDSDDGTATAIATNGSRTAEGSRGPPQVAPSTLEIHWDDGTYPVYTGLVVELQFPNGARAVGQCIQPVPFAQVPNLAVGRQLTCARDPYDATNSHRFVVDWDATAN